MAWELGGCWSFLDRGTQSTDDLADFNSLANKSVEMVLTQVADVESNVEVGPQFSARRLCDGKKVLELRRAASFESLSNIRHDGNRRPANLISKAIVLCEASHVGSLVHLSGQRSCFLLRNKVFESLSLGSHNGLLVD
jgi:hypothetical protein